MKLAGKTAIVTGGGRGIGRGIALAFAREGANVAVAARTAEQVNAVAREIESLGRRTFPIVADVSNSADIQLIIKETVTHLGGIDILVNNAGGASLGDVVEITEENWNHCIDLNLGSTFMGSKYAIPEMRKRGGGSIINMSSTRGVSARPKNAAYGAAKAAIIHLTKSMAIDFAADDIRVNCICPGAIATERNRQLVEVIDDPAAFEEFLSDFDDERQRRYRQLRDDPAALHGLLGGNAPLNRRGTADEIGRTAVFLSSDDASYITGAIIMVDGGRSAGA